MKFFETFLAFLSVAHFVVGQEVDPPMPGWPAADGDGPVPGWAAVAGDVIVPTNEKAEGWMSMTEGFEGDILLSEEQLRQLNSSEPAERNAITSSYKVWPNNVIPYIIDPDSGYTADQIKAIEDGVATYNARTNGCVKVVKRTNQADYVKVVSQKGCFSYVGRQGGMQEVMLLASGCLSLSTIVHEFMHASGFWHEHNRPDRDNYIYLHMENVDAKWHYAFDRRSSSRKIGYYDYKSVMHYNAFAFSNNNKMSITRKDGKAPIFGNSNGFSDQDVEKMRVLYGCATTVGPSTKPTEGPCVNARSSCDYWASLKYCTETYTSFMLKNCQKACGYCSGGSATTTAAPTTAAPCEDKSQHCSYWKRLNYCTETYVGYMRANCAKTCGHCQ